MEKRKKIRVLQIVPNMRSAGIENFIMNLYRNIDLEKVQFDFLVHNKEKKDFDEEIEKMGGKIYRLSYKDDKNIFKYIRDLNRFFKEHKEYEIVHGQMQSMMPLYLYIAKKNGVPIRIAHAHNSHYEKSMKGILLHFFSRFSKKYATDLWACSKNSGEYLFGKRKFEIIHNAIDMDKFQYNEEVREKVREKEGLKEKFVIGHIGRFELQKNHEFLIDIFYELQKLMPNAVLLCFGCGGRQEQIKEKVKRLHIENKVYFKGVVSNTEEYYQGMDCFLLPSKYEGLPLVGVEAQVSGLPCFFSSTITKELELSKTAYFLDLALSPLEWAKFIQKNDKVIRKTNYIDSYDLCKESRRIAKKYKELIERNDS